MRECQKLLNHLWGPMGPCYHLPGERGHCFPSLPDKCFVGHILLLIELQHFVMENGIGHL